jgi:hypothetical protein
MLAGYEEVAVSVGKIMEWSKVGEEGYVEGGGAV